MLSAVDLFLQQKAKTNFLLQGDMFLIKIFSWVNSSLKKMLSLDDKKFASFKVLIFLYYFICADWSLMLVQGQQFSIKEDCWWTNTIVQSLNLLFKVFICTSQPLAHVQNQQFSIKKDCWWTYVFRLTFKFCFTYLFFIVNPVYFFASRNFFFVIWEFFLNFNNFLWNSVNSI